MKILHVISSGGMYGAEAVILNLLHSMRSGPHRAALAIFENHPNPNLQLHEQALASGLESYTIACKGQLDLSTTRSLRVLTQDVGADLMHAHGYKADVYTYAAMRAIKLPLVSTCHTWYDNDRAARMYGALDRLTLRRYTRVVAVSEEVQQRLLGSGVRSERITLIRNGVDLRSFAGVPDSPGPAPDTGSRFAKELPLRVGLVGRLAPEKGVDILLRAAVGVLADLPLTQFLIAGDGPDRDRLQSRIEELGIGSHVRLVGRQKNMPAFYASLDLLVSSSRQEGLPIALLEGMASSLPIVATAVGAVPSLVQQGCTGDLVPSGNVAALTTAIIRLLQSPGLRQSYGAAGRERVASEFSVDRMAADYLRVYKQAVEQQ